MVFKRRAVQIRKGIFTVQRGLHGKKPYRLSTTIEWRALLEGTSTGLVDQQIR